MIKWYDVIEMVSKDKNIGFHMDISIIEFYGYIKKY